MSAGDPWFDGLERRALERLEQVGDDLGVSSPIDFGEILHDLRVHRIELEMQAEELREAMLRHEVAARRFRQLFQSLPHGAVVTDRIGTMLDANRLATATFGLDPSVGKVVLATVGADDDSTRALRSLFVDADRNGRAHVEEVAAKGADGRRLLVDVWVERLDAAGDGEADRFIVSIIDVTARHEEQQHLRLLEQRERQTQRLDSLGQLTGGVAHDFNNLLSVILGSADELIADGTLRPEQDKLVAMIHRAADRGADLTRRLLAFSRKQVLEPRMLEIDPLIAEVMDTLVRRTIGEHIALEVDLAAGVVVDLDGAQFESALLNLVVNARDAISESGRVTVTSRVVEIDERTATERGVIPGRYVSIWVADSGCGIDALEQEHVFEPFFTTKPTGQGTGLGLSIVMGFAQQSGGSARLVGSSTSGTTIEVLLPVAASAMSSTILPTASSPSSAEPPPTAIVLLVEDDDMLRSLAAQQLRSLGHTVVSTTTAEEALIVATSRDDIELLFTDVLLPGMDGKRLADEMLRMHPSVKVLFTSGYTRDALGADGRMPPGTRLLAKPYRRSELEAAIRDALAG